MKNADEIRAVLAAIREVNHKGGRDWCHVADTVRALRWVLGEPCREIDGDLRTVAR